MAGLRMIGAGLPRTGTRSLQTALQQILGGDCYHMTVVFEHLDDVPVWRRALAGEAPDWDAFLANYVAAVDWPASSQWRELGEAYPDAVVVLSTRSDPRTWWSSVESTILSHLLGEPSPELAEWWEMGKDLQARMGCDWHDPQAAMTAYERHNAEVRSTVPASRLLDWQARDGWEPICRALGVAVPDEPFPHVNTREEWAQRRAEEQDQAE